MTIDSISHIGYTPFLVYQNRGRMPVTKAIRLSDSELKKIERFLEQNPFFDFSTLARVALQSFITSPTIQIKPLEMGKAKRRKASEESRANDR